MPKKVQVYKKKKKISENEVISGLQAKYKDIDISKIRKFTDLPLSSKTLKALTQAKFISPSEVQTKTIPLALKGHDVLACAETGSGKTLAFLIPVLENLYCKQWTGWDGLGALIITPCRELANQIYKTMIELNTYHRYTCRLIIGGINDKEFKKLQMPNIIVCTPGRFLENMYKDSIFDCNSLQILVLDEADYLLETDFKNDMDGIISNLPIERQTLLLSATLSNKVQDLARLSLQNPINVTVHKAMVPDHVKQYYTELDISEKIWFLWSFIRRHRKQKIIVFFQSCKQVKYVNEVFCKMRPGISLMALYGTLSQFRRQRISDEFRRKQFAVLFATDLAARGLDFPNVDWVVQMDCPESTDTYVHRAGRTGRFRKEGESLLVLLPSEIEIIQKLNDSRIIKKPKHLDEREDPEKRLNNILVANVEFKESAQRAFLCYIKSIVLMKDKSIFDVKKLDFDGFARSLGLAVTPRVRFLKRQENRNKAAEAKKNPFAALSDESDNEDVLKIKRRNVNVEEELPDVEIETEEMRAISKKPVTKASVVKKILKKNIVANTKTVFDDEGKEILDPTRSKVSELAKQYENMGESGINIEIAKKILMEEDKIDKEKYREKVKERRREKKRKLKAQRKGRRDDEDNEEDEDGENYSSEEGPDISWIPDPDKIYGKQKKEKINSEDEDDESQDEESEDESEEDDEDENDEEDDDENESSEESEEEVVQKLSKRKTVMEDKLEKKRKRLFLNNDLQTDETLALQLLQGS